MTPTDELLEMLSYMRPHLSVTEEAFIERFLRPLPGFHQDAFGNGYVRIGADQPEIMWSSHTDTVHRDHGFQEVIVVDEEAQLAFASPSNCLGGDNTVGVWLMVNMIREGVPGLYIFHRGEERGCLGSKYIAENLKILLDGINFAIAFDRRGISSIITEQMMGQTASDAFATDLAALLNMGHLPDPTGIYTDTASYADLIPECTNVSAGFSSEHSSNETVALWYTEWLLERVLTADFSVLSPYRKPGDYGDYYGNFSWGGGSVNGGSYLLANSVDEFDEMANFVFRHPDEVAELLINYGFSPSDVRRECGI